MGLPFVIVEGPILVVDEQGNIVKVYKPSSGPNRLSTLAGLVGLNSDGTQQTLVGSVDDRLKVQAVFAPDGLIIPTLGTGLVYEDMNTSNGGVSRNTTIGSSWTTIYSKTSISGILLGFLVTVENVSKDWFIRLKVDGNEVFGASGINFEDLQDKDVYGFDRSPSDNIPEFLGFLIRENTFRWEGPSDLPMRHTSDIEILLRKTGGSKKFRAGLLTRSTI